MNLKYNLFSIIVLLLGITMVVSCQNEADVAEAKGGLRIMLNSISTSTLTRATPKEIGKPVADKFNVKVEDENGQVKYNKGFTEELIPLVGGSYTVTATCGDNPIIATDAPYYIGTASVQVEEGKTTEANISCKVGNSLISIIFGSDDAERARFKKFYLSYGINVKLGAYSVSIPSTASGMSAYFRAGSTPELEFYGVLRTNNKKVSMTLDLSTKENYPQTFQAADHAIVTLTLPDPESATVLEISKVELEEATIEETIPLSWLPIPQAIAEHQYNTDGDLVGTNVTFSNNYPGMTWKAVVTDAQNTVYRTTAGTGNLESTCSDNTEGWPYIPAGTYTATYYLIQEGQEEPMKTGSRDFVVANPDLKVTVDGYTSYSKYLEGDVDAANACDAFTIYAPSTKINVSPSLLSNSNYSYSLATSLNDSPLTGKQNGNTFTYNNQTEKAPSFEAYTIASIATFDKATATGQKDVFITGLPVTFAPPTKNDGWQEGENKVTWNEDNTQLGQMAGAGHHSIEYKNFAIPSGTTIDCPYNVQINTGWVGTTLSLLLDNNVYFSKEQSGALLGNSATYSKDTNIITTSNNISSAKADCSYGSGQTYCVIYSLSYKYGK